MALATVFAQFVGFVLVAIWLIKVKLPFPFAKKDIRADAGSTGYIFKVGLPLVLQDLVISISFMIIMGLVNRIGDGVTASASVAVVSRIFSLGTIVPMSVGAAIAAITAQNLGAGKPERARKAMKWGIIYSAAFNLAFVLVCQFFAAGVTGLFSNDRSVIDGAANYLHGFVLDSLMVAFVFCFNAYLSGIGKSTIVMYHSLLGTFGLRVPLSIIICAQAGLTVNATLFRLGFASPIASIVPMIICVWYITWYNRKHRGDFQALGDAQ